jgi:hypothetical protein
MEPSRLFQVLVAGPYVGGMTGADGEKSLTSGDFLHPDRQLNYRSGDFVDRRGRDGRNLLQYRIFGSRNLDSWPKPGPPGAAETEPRRRSDVNLSDDDRPIRCEGRW